ncbi:MAG: hypothetical protein LBQ34_06825, partial [Alphaproteobacteria bacterium]|nr:hypothetical protein [Alphaproteobacteria bacterium]
MEFDNKYLIAQLCDNKTLDDFKVLLDFYRYLSNLLYKTKDYNLYQIKLQWLLDTLFTDGDNGAVEVDKFKILTQKYALSKADIIKMIEAKTIDMDNFPFSGVDSLLNYIESTDGVFWNLYGRILFGDSLLEDEKAKITNMAKAFGIMESLRFAEFKKSRGVYVLLFSSADANRAVEAEKENVKNLLSLAKGFIKESSKKGGRLRRLLLLNYISADFFKNLEKVDFKIDNPSVNNISKLTYFKII